MPATHRQGLGPVVGDLFLDSDVPACERVTVSRNGWSAEVTHLWTGHGWTRLVPGPVHHVPAQPLVTRSTQAPVSSPVGTRKRSSKKAAPPAPLQPTARRVPVCQVRNPEPALAEPELAEPPAAELVPGGAPVDDDAPAAATPAAATPATATMAAATSDVVTSTTAPTDTASEEPEADDAAGDSAPGDAESEQAAPSDITLPPTPVVPRQPATRTPDAGSSRRPVRHASRR